MSKISGYRELSQEDIDLINEAKEIEAKLLELHARVNNHIDQTCGLAYAAQASRWHAIARTDIETGFMALVRSIAQPQPIEY